MTDSQNGPNVSKSKYITECIDVYTKLHMLLNYIKCQINYDKLIIILHIMPNHAFFHL